MDGIGWLSQVLVSQEAPSAVPIIHYVSILQFDKENYDNIPVCVDYDGIF